MSGTWRAEDPQAAETVDLERLTVTAGDIAAYEAGRPDWLPKITQPA